MGTKEISYLVMQDALTICYPNLFVKVNCTNWIYLKTGKIMYFIIFDTSNFSMVTRGANLGRIGVITNIETLGSFDIIHVKNAMPIALPPASPTFFVIDKGNKP